MKKKKPTIQERFRTLVEKNAVRKENTPCLFCGKLECTGSCLIPKKKL